MSVWSIVLGWRIYKSIGERVLKEHPQQVEMRCANEWQQRQQAYARLTRLLSTEDDALPADGITEAFISKGAKSILKRWHKGCVHICKPGSHVQHTQGHVHMVHACTYTHIHITIHTYILKKIPEV